MMLFIGNLPQSVTRERLAAALRLTREDVQRLRVVRKPDHKGDIRRYAVIQPRTPAQTNRLLGRNGKLKLEGQRLVIREFYKRIANNERRAPNWRNRPWPHAERRRTERRRAASEQLAAA